MIQWDINGIPSGELTFCYGKSPFFMGISTINGHFPVRYVKLPEGTCFQLFPLAMLVITRGSEKLLLTHINPYYVPSGYDIHSSPWKRWP